MIKNKRDHLGILLVSIFIIAILKWLTETILRYFAVSTDIITGVTITGWGLFTFCSLWFLRNWTVSYRESYQTKEEDSEFAHELFLLKQGSGVHMEDITGEFRGLYWRLHIRIPKEEGPSAYQKGTENHSDIQIQYVEGPYCPRDNCSMKQKRTYLGKYQFRCQNCHYKMKKTDSKSTLIHDLQETDHVQKMLDNKVSS